MDKEILLTTKLFNTGSTLKRSEQYKRKRNLNSKLEINPNENITLGDIIGKFLTEYIRFQEEYSKIKELLNYDELTYIEFKKHENERSLVLSFNDENNKILNSECGYLLLVMEEQNGGYSSWITNNDIAEKLEFKEEKLDPKIIQRHIDLFEKPHKILDAYKEIIGKVLLFGNGSNTLNIDIKGNILNKLETIKIYFGNDIGRTDYISFQIEIGTPNKLTAEIIKIDGQIIEPTSELITHFLNNIYLNKEYLPLLYHDNNEKEINKEIKFKIINKKG